MIHLTLDYQSDLNCRSPGEYLRYHRTFQGKTTREVAESVGTEDSFVTNFKRFHEAGEVSDEIVKELLKEVIVYPNGRLEVVWKYQDSFITA